MQNCIFSGHCSQQVCDKSCPTLVETTYLLERNNIAMNSDVFHADRSKLSKFSNSSTRLSRHSILNSKLLTFNALSLVIY